MKTEMLVISLNSKYRKFMANIKEKITLEEFQKGKLKFPHEEFIYYIRNPHFYSRWQSIIKPPGIKGIIKIFFDLINSWGYKSQGEKNIVFLGYRNRSLDSNKTIIDILKSTKKLSRKNTVLVIGKGDYEIDDELLRHLPGNIQYLFANNINTYSPLTKYLPMGRDFRSRSLFSEVMPQYKKERLCYCNYSVTTHPQRRYLYEQIKDIDYIEFEHMGNFRDYSVSRKEFYENVSKSKFVICPRGRATDTFRLWDCLYLGAVPIVVKEAVFHEYISDLPILFLDSYEQFSDLNEKILSDYYKQMLKTKYNYTKLRFSYWIDKIENC